MPEEKEEYIPLAQRGWSDVTPVPQDDGENPLVPIMYSEKYRDAMDYFRAAMKSGEKSERVLDLTQAIIDMNPGHYTVWQYRFSTLIVTKADLNAELEHVTQFARVNLKSYQVWHHRLLLLTEISPKDISSEVEYIHSALEPDAKNYHTWAYLHWLYCYFYELGRVTDEMWEKELAWCESLLAEDGRNNSAWGWRWFLCMARPKAKGVEGAKTEIDYALNEIHRIPHNASAWNYLRGVIRAASLPRTPLLPVLAPYMLGSAVDLPPDNLDATAEWPARTTAISEDTPTPVPPALEFLADALVEEHRNAEAAKVFTQLGTEVDRMRAAYWDMRQNECCNA